MITFFLNNSTVTFGETLVEAKQHLTCERLIAYVISSNS